DPRDLAEWHHVVGQLPDTARPGRRKRERLQQVALAAGTFPQRAGMSAFSPPSICRPSAGRYDMGAEGTGRAPAAASRALSTSATSLRAGKCTRASSPSTAMPTVRSVGARRRSSIRRAHRVAERLLQVAHRERLAEEAREPRLGEAAGRLRVVVAAHQDDARVGANGADLAEDPVARE